MSNGKKYENEKLDERRKYFIPEISIDLILDNQNTPIGISFGEKSKIYDRGIFQQAYRKKVCACCRKSKASDEFYWKIKGFEGPFESLWGTRQPKCIACEKRSKKTQYKKRVKKLKRVTNVIFGFNTSEVFLTGNDMSQVLARLILDFSQEVINGTDKN